MPKPEADPCAGKARQGRAPLPSDRESTFASTLSETDSKRCSLAMHAPISRRFAARALSRRFGFRRLRAAGGAALVIDYGGSVLSGDTVQAVRRHEKARARARARGVRTYRIRVRIQRLELQCSHEGGLSWCLG